MRAGKAGRPEWLGRQDGLSLLEVLVASALMVVVSLAMTLAYASMRVAASKDSGRFAQIGALDAGIRAIATDLRTALQVNTATGCAVGTESSLTFTDPSGNTVTYQLSGTQLQRGVNGGSFAVITYPVSRLAVCYDTSGAFPTYKITLTNTGYSLSTTVVPRLMPNSQGATME